MRTPHRHLSVDELSYRASTGLAIRRGDVKISDPIPSSYVHNGAEMDGVHDQPTPRIDTTATWSGRVGPGPFHGRSGSTPLLSQSAHTSKFTERTSLGPSFSTSNMSSTPVKDLTPRKDSGLRASLKRMFSKKSTGATIQKRNTHQGDSIRSPPHPPPAHGEPFYQSPNAYRKIATPGQALNSHATHPNVETEPVGDVVQDMDSNDFEKRRNTVPDLSNEPTMSPAALRQCHFSATRERPATPKPETGFKRDVPPTQLLKRRSTSADALTDLLRSPVCKIPDRRDRSEEIAFWRNSVIVNPLPRIPVLESTSSLSSMSSGKSPHLASSKQQRPSIEPAQDFDFGLNDNSNLVRPSTLQERVNTLEVKLFDFEYALAKLQGNDLEKPSLPKKVSREKSAHNSYPESGDSSSTNGTSQFSSPRERRQPSSPPPHPRSQSRADRTSKATTVKPAHGRRPSSRSHISNTSIHITHSQYDALRTLIENEQNARQQLEVQVVNLQNQMETLKTPVPAYNGPALYPTPSPDSCHHSGQLKTSGSGGHPVPRTNKDTNETSRFSMSETEPETELDNDGFDSVEARSPDLFRTPQENHFHFDSRTISPSGMF